jgi:hypothetical protein
LNLSKLPSEQPFKLTFITRRFFAETTKDYLIRKIKSTNSSGGLGVSATYEFYEWSILKGPGRHYILGLLREYWNITVFSETNVTLDTDLKPTNLRLILNETLSNNQAKIEIYDEFSFKVIDRNDRDYLWLILENSVYETYIIRYKIEDLFPSSNPGLSTGNNSAPYIWKLSNPYYGFESSYEIKAIKSDWLLVHFKVMNDVSYMMVYIVPPQIFPAKPNSILETLFVKEAVLFSNVKDLQLEKQLELIGSYG